MFPRGQIFPASFYAFDAQNAGLALIAAQGQLHARVDAVNAGRNPGRFPAREEVGDVVVNLEKADVPLVITEGRLTDDPECRSRPTTSFHRA